MEIPFQPAKHPCGMKRHVSKCFCFHRTSLWASLHTYKFPNAAISSTRNKFQTFLVLQPKLGTDCRVQLKEKAKRVQNRRKTVLQQGTIDGNSSAALCCLVHFPYRVSSCFLCLLYSTYPCSKPVPWVLASQHTQDVSRRAAQQRGVFLLSAVP